jgi:hypothetical protein
MLPITEESTSQPATREKTMSTQRKALVVALALVACSAISPGSFAQDKKIPPDARISKALDSENLRYTVEESGEYSVVIEWSNDAGRTQLVRIPSDTFRWQGGEYRDVYSVAFVTDEDKPVEGALANRLLVENNDSLLGFWAKQGDVVMNIARIPAGATPSTLRAAVFFVAETADDLEKEVTRKDDY